MAGLGLEGETTVASLVEARVRYDVVIPTLGRTTLRTLLLDLARACACSEGPLPERIILVDDRVDKRGPLLSMAPPVEIAPLLRVLPGRARGPAAARNLGWRAGSAPWTVFLDDDVRPPADWLVRVVHDLMDLEPDVAASQGRIHVPLPRHRAPTDWERNVAGLERAQWATADMAVRRRVLVKVAGFDERFPRAYREDADLGLRITAAGYRIVSGARVIHHPVRAANAWVSVRLQRGNADDALMRALHGPDWRERAGSPPGARAGHMLTSAAAAAALIALAAGAPLLALVAAALCTLSIARFTWRRIEPGPRTIDEIVAMILTSSVLPFAATWHYLRGVLRSLRLTRARPSVSVPPSRRGIRAVLVDRDGTLIEDVPYNGDPARVRPLPAARQALDRLRAAGLPIVVVTNQSGVGRGRITHEQMHAVNERVEALLGPFDGWFVCPHGPEEACACRKPRAGLVEAAARALHVEPDACVVIGDIEADMLAARACGAWSVLVPTQATRAEEVWDADEIAADLGAAADRVVLRSSP